MPRCVVLIRHAEKPVGGVPGFDADSRPDAEGLTLRGWQRAGALVPLFAGRDGRRLDDRLPLPATLFAAADAGRSRRPEYTLMPLAAALGVPLQTLASGGDPHGTAAALSHAASPVLVCWRHHELPRLGAAIGRGAPQAWPADCFDQAWVFGNGGGGGFCAVPLHLLAGDA